MFQSATRRTRHQTAFATAEVIFHLAVRNVRKSHGNAVRALVMMFLTSVMMVGVMYFTFSLFGMRRVSISGADFLLFVMSGVLPYMFQSVTISAVAGAESATSSMMNHTPMNTIVAISAAALTALYKQIFSIAAITLLYHCLWHPIYIDDPVGVMAMLIVSWLSGIGIGMIIRAALPWHRDFFSMVRSLYIRMNMLFSGKMMVANAMGMYMLWMFMWNPLFHIIDQTRGFMFLNYEPRHTNALYPFLISVLLIILGLMGESFTSKRMSRSWDARD